MSGTSIPLPDAERSDLLPVLIQALYIVAPLQILMVYVGTTELTAGMALGALIGILGALLIASSRLTVRWRNDRPIVYMVFFLCLAVLSTSQTIYGAPAIQKGAINLSAIFAMVLMVIVVKQAFVQWPHLFPQAVRITAVTTGFAGLTAIFQSVVSNVLLQPELFDLRFINDFWGTNWWRFSPQGLVRAQGIYGEPSFLSAYIGMSSGLAMMRLGVFGPEYRNDVSSVVPAWAAASVLLSVILSFSSVAYAGLFAAYLGGLASRMTFSARSIVFLVIGSAAAAAILTVAALQAGDAIRERILDLAVFSQFGSVDGPGRLDQDTNLSVQVLFLNAYVTLQNVLANPGLGAGVGAHPFAYDALVPALPLASQTAIGLNAQDANSLALRLLSETGLLGTLAFTIAVLSAWLRVRRVVLTQDSDLRTPLKALAIALNSGLAGVFAAKMLRVPSYYGAEFWALFGLCITIPALASMSASALSRKPHVSWKPGEPQIALTGH